MSKTVLFQAIQFRISTQFSSISLIDRTLSNSRPEWERWQWKYTPHSLKLPQFLNLTIRLFSVISKTFNGGLTPLQRCSRYIIQPQPTVSVISRTLVGGGLTPLQKSSRCILKPQLTGPVISRTLVGMLLTYGGETVGVFYNPCRLGQ